MESSHPVINEDSNITMIIDISKKLDNSGEMIEKIQQLLKALDNVQVNTNILKVTRIGKKMTKYAQHKFPGISKLASDLVAKWKKEVQLEARRAGPRTDASSNVGRASPPREPQRTEPTAEPAKEEEDRSVPKSRVREADVEYAEQQKLEEQSESFDEYISKHKARDDKARRKIQESIHKCLLKQDPSNSKKAEANAIKVEVGLFKLYQGKPADYSNKARTILANLMRSDDFK